MNFTDDGWDHERCCHRFHNDAYSVMRCAGGMWLSIQRRDGEPMRSWRDMQDIKNLLLGAEVEAVELFPAESRLVDGGRVYHLWALPPGVRFPFGFRERFVVERAAV